MQFLSKSGALNNIVHFAVESGFRPKLKREALEILAHATTVEEVALEVVKSDRFPEIFSEAFESKGVEEKLDTIAHNLLSFPSTKTAVASYLAPVEEEEA